ncbi:MULTISPECIES: hypothetical protein [unclassified Microcoleus]|uniref:hypothetical protein n=1 Tax=unclassified Microcoleus TaxID=2642155 RepID=UPI0025E63B34|nr:MULTISPECIES: hypothetical protein [unclassified Microcoleus]
MITVGGRLLFAIALPRVLLDFADIRSRPGVGGHGAVPAGDRTFMYCTALVRSRPMGLEEETGLPFPYG